MYYCFIKSNNSHGRLYDVGTKSALKCAEMYGRYEGGETITVYRKRSKKIIDKAVYNPENGGYYYKIDPVFYDPDEIRKNQ